MSNDSEAKRKLLFDVMKVQENETLLVVFDHFGQPLAEFCAEAATEFSVALCATFVPVACQLTYVELGAVPAHLLRCPKECKTLLFAVSDLEECTSFRACVLTGLKDADVRILHVPGVSKALFIEHLARIDLAQLQREASTLADSIQSARQIEIHTSEIRDSQSVRHTLLLSLTDRAAHCDVGVPAPGNIAQIPAGEVYVAPREGTAQGTLVLNGSAPDRVFGRKDLAILSFEDGVLSLENSVFEGSFRCEDFLAELYAYRERDARNLWLGEFGIGLNTLVTTLTGKAIRDEKAVGTCHIALGNNKPFGGSIGCNSHIDLIFIPNRLLLDGHELARRWGLGRH